MVFIKGYRQTEEHKKRIGFANKGKQSHLGIKHSEETKKKISFSNTGILSSQWKGNNAKYQAIHGWIHLHYGLAHKCENLKCIGKSQQYQWALKPNCKYTHDIKMFIQLCRSCHHKMDMTQETRDKISKANKKFIICKITNCGRNYIAKDLCKKHYLQQWRNDSKKG